MNSNNSKIDYAGRTVDLLLLKTILDVPFARTRMGIDVSNVVGEPMIVSGIEKMVQRFANIFITEMGSAKFRETYGTNLVTRVKHGFVYNMATLEAEAAEANMLARTQMRQADENEEGTPPDERLANSEVVDLVFSKEKATVRISILLTTEAGSSYTYIIPVPVGVH
jgi:hypothetical protein